MLGEDRPEPGLAGGARPILIAGPTASGKSALALALAERHGGVVINADALQVYACWRVLTARPDAAAEARAPHRLYGHVDCGAGYSVGLWLRDVAAAMAEARALGLRPIVVGGTGLYFDALTRGLVDAPASPPELRARSQAMIDAGALPALVADLARRDPETLATLDARNPMRVQRAWEVLEATGRGLASWRRAPATPLMAPDACERFAIIPETSYLNNTIRGRLEQMVQTGALDECARFHAAGHSLAAPSGRALGAAEFIAHLEGRLSLSAAIEAAAAGTRRYAKRQRTWIRNRMADWPRLDPASLK